MDTYQGFIKRITDDKRCTITSGANHTSIAMEKMQRTDSGILNLTVSNAHGVNTYKIEVLVLGKHYEQDKKKKSFVLICSQRFKQSCF